jgi:hypothetical protein
MNRNKIIDIAVDIRTNLLVVIITPLLIAKAAGRTALAVKPPAWLPFLLNSWLQKRDYAGKVNEE